MAKLIFRYGAMNCGKTLHLLQTDYNYREHDLKTLVIKPSVDTKGGTSIVTRIGLKRKVDVLLRPHDNVRQKLDITDSDNIQVKSVTEVESAKNMPTSSDNIKTSLSKVGDSIYNITSFNIK